MVVGVASGVTVWQMDEWIRRQIVEGENQAALSDGLLDLADKVTAEELRQLGIRMWHLNRLIDDHRREGDVDDVRGQLISFVTETNRSFHSDTPKTMLLMIANQYLSDLCSSLGVTENKKICGEISPEELVFKEVEESSEEL